MLPVFFAVYFGLILQVHCYIIGAPEGTCDDMLPNHGVVANNTPVPYVIKLSSNSYSPNKNISVTIEIKRDTVFEGFIMAARRKGEIENFGSFYPVSGTHTLKCSNKNNSSITHSNNSKRKNLTVIWEAPAINVGDLQMTATIVRTKLIFWMNVTSEVLRPSISSFPTMTTPPLKTTPEINGIQCESSTKCQIRWQMDKVAGVTYFNFTLESLNTNMYIALGLSHDSKMGDDSVMECARYPNGSIAAQLSYNSGYINTLVASESLTLTSTSFANGLMSCSFTRKNTVSNPKIFDLAGKDWYLLVAIGNVDLNRANLKKEHSTKFASKSKIDLSKATGLHGIESFHEEVLVSVHGSLMIFAWVFFASIGMFSARYSKAINKTIKGVALWFQLHRVSMVFTLLLTVIGFILIFVEEGEYSESVGLPYDAHPVLGIIVTALTVINPIMASFRPDKSSSKRPLFNFAHRSVGVIAFILADAAIFIGIFWYHGSTTEPKASITVMSFFIIYKVIAVVIMELLERWEERTIGSTEVNAPGENKTAEKRKDTFGYLKAVLLGVHIIVSFVLSVLLVIFLNIKPEDEHEHEHDH